MLKEILTAGKTGLAGDLFTELEGRAFFGSAVGERELTGVVPLRFNSDGTSLLDWHIKGAAGGVGKPRKNYLAQTSVSLNNGHASGSYSGTASWTVSSGGPYIPEDEMSPQWLVSAYSANISYGGRTYGIDDRSETYANSQYKLTLGAGSYKLIFEAVEYAGEWPSDCLSRWSGYGSPVIKLMKSDDTQLLRRVINTAEYQDMTFVHEEYAFTLSESTDLGLYFLGMGTRILPRFMIVDSSTVTEPFSVMYMGTVFSGNTCWEPYHAVLPLTVTAGGQTSTVTIDLGTSLLYENDTLTFTGTGIQIPTYSGANVLDVDSAVKPSEVYIKYIGW